MGRKSPLFMRFQSGYNMRFASLEELQKSNRIPTVSGGLSVLSFVASTLGLDLFASLTGKTDAQAKKDFLNRFGTLKTHGIANSLSEYVMYPDEPQGYITTVGLTGRKSFGYAGRGVDMFDRKKTYLPAIGESVERWAVANYDPHDSIRSSNANLKKPKLDIFSFAGFSEEKRRDSRFPLRITNDTIFRWVRGRSLIDGKKTYIPLQTISFVPSREKNREPLISFEITTGAAAGKTYEDAVLGGLFEVIERDAFMIHWLNQTTPDQIDLSTVPDVRVRKMIDIAHRYRLELYPLYLLTDAPAHTVACVCLDRSGIGPAVTIGMSTHLSLIEATYKSVAEVLATRSPSRRRVEQNKDEIPKKEDVGHLSRLFYWSRPEKIRDITPWISGVKKPFSTFPMYRDTGTSKEKLNYLLEFFKHEHYTVVAKEILPRRLRRKFKMTVVFVKVPEFQPLFVDERFACTNGKRLIEVPKKFNWNMRTPGGTCTEPHPFL
jgi:ribosomal protein S12 methylthiotransferase accessory factor